MRKGSSGKKSSFGADLIEGMKLIAAHKRGEIELEQVWPRPIDVKAIRKQVKMSQAEFSRTYGISKRAGMGAGRPATGFGRARLSDGYCEGAGHGAPSAGRGLAGVSGINGVGSEKGAGRLVA